MNVPFLSERLLGLMGQSMLLAAASSGLAVVLGSGMAIVLWQKTRTRQTLPVAGLLLLSSIPPHVHAWAWITCAASLNRWCADLNLARLSFTGFGAAVWVMVMSTLPLAAGMSLIGLRSVDKSLVEGGLLLATPSRCARRILLPLAGPLWRGAFLLLFVLALTDYSVPSLFSVNVYPMEIFAEFSATNDPWAACLAGLPMILFTAGLLWISRKTITALALSSPEGRGHGSTPVLWPLWMRAWLGLGSLMGILAVSMPFMALGLSQGRSSRTWSALSNAWPEITHSLVIGLSAAGLSVLLASSLAPRLAAGRKAWPWSIVSLPLAFPGALVGIVLLTVFSQPGLVAIRGGLLLPVLACVVRFFPLAVFLLASQLHQSFPGLSDAAIVYQRNRFHRWARIDLPLRLPGFLVAFFAVALLSFHELGATLMVTPAGRSTLAIRLYNLLHYGASEEVAGLSLAAASFTAAAFLALILCQGLLRKGDRLT